MATGGATEVLVWNGSKSKMDDVSKSSPAFADAIYFHQMAAPHHQMYSVDVTIQELITFFGEELHKISLEHQKRVTCLNIFPIVANILPGIGCDTFMTHLPYPTSLYGSE